MPALDDRDELRRRVAAAAVGRLATLRPDGTPRLVPVTFAAVPSDAVPENRADDLLCFAVDEVKPKRHARLARLTDIARDDRVALLVDHYDADWATLWWVRVDGRAAVHADGPLRARALALLAAKYPAYRAAPPRGPVVAITPLRWAGWVAT
jgi:PPOX class probable F420-dependent enzyme